MTSIPRERLGSETLDLEGAQVPEWLARPFQLVSLFEMIRFHTVKFYVGGYWVHSLMDDLRDSLKSDRDFKLTEEHVEAVKEIIDKLYAEAKQFGFQRTFERLERLSSRLPNLIGFGAMELLHHVRELDLALASDLSEKHFFYMPLDRIGYYEQDELFGADVNTNFPSTVNDIKEAGNCYATGRNTACVFHCMRVLEKGLHVVVHDLNNRFNAGITFRKEIEATNWGTIIDEIQNTLTQPKRRGLLNPVPASDDLTFYAKAAREFEYFKDAWRNDVSHSRSSYDENEAKAVMEHVKAFMQQISSKLCE